MHRTGLSLALLSLLSTTLLSAPPHHPRAQSGPVRGERTLPRILPLTAPVAKTERLDSIVSPNEWKNVYTYDGLKPSGITEFEWKNGAWVPKYRDTYTYTVEGKPPEEVEWEHDGRQWQQKYKYTFEYLESGFSVTSYDSGDGGTWVFSWKDSLYVSPDGTKDEWYYFAWENGQRFLRSGEKTGVAFDDAGRVLMLMVERFDRQSQTWTSSSKEAFVHNEQGELASITELDYDTELAQYVPSYKEEYTYTASGLLNSHVSYDYVANEWYATHKIEWVYDANDNPTSQTWWVVNAGGELVVGETSTEEYDLNVRAESVLTGNWYDLAYDYDDHYPSYPGPKNKLVRRCYSSVGDSRCRVYYYSPLSSSAIPGGTLLSPASSAALQIGNRSIRVDAEGPARLMLFSPQGRLVFARQVSGQERVSLGHLAAGSYTLRLLSGERVEMATVTLR